MAITEEELVNSGLVYVKCPICGHVVMQSEKTRVNDTCFKVQVFCYKCDKTFFGFEDCNFNFDLWNKPFPALFSTPDYKTHAFQYGKEIY